MKLFAIIFFACVLFVFFVRYLESVSIFYPQKEIEFFPSADQFSCEDVYFTTEDGLTLNGWFFHTPQAQATLLFFHGNGGNICHRLEKVLLFQELGVNIFIVDYRGYGKSQGAPSEQGIYKDALAAFDYLVSRQDIAKDKIVGYGESLGGVVVLELASKRSCAALIIDSSFSSAADMAQKYYPFVPPFLLTTKMDAAQKASQVRIPKLFIHSVQDDIVPFLLGQKLFAAAAEPKEFLELQGDHNSGFEISRRDYSGGIKKFLAVQGLLP